MRYHQDPALPWDDFADAFDVGYRDSKPENRFKRSDIADVLAQSEGENDELNWIGVYRLKSGKYGYLSAGCDYTGWGCQDWGDMRIRDNFEDLVLLDLTPQERDRLKIKVVGLKIEIES